ncbi:MAG TPA: prenyltransferase/squalene oxidase repeat-containing protein [Lacipirellulaceae bacterium]|jgi:squalene-hopene/tetraprenyl-beta-curcumene cyclase|nr:prenyltransferase/squalene oxidase repeat-containing protein [Lacipirellulaceae bacterium]
MNLEVDFERLSLACKAVRAELLAERAPGGYWEGQICSSPVATAAAVSALVVSHRQEAEDVLRRSAAGDTGQIEELVQGDLSELLVESLHWLARRQNEDGGWGDCEGAESNIAATMLVQAAFRVTGIPAKYADLMVRADDFVELQEGIVGLRRQYANDKVYLASVLATCAAADMITWRQVPTLPFEWLHLPKRWRSELQLPVGQHLTSVVMAVGLAKFHNDPSRNPLTRIARQSLQKRSLTLLEKLQASDDSFLASPLATAFIVLSLTSADCQQHAIVRRGIEFLLTAVRADASWSLGAGGATGNTVRATASFAPIRAAHEGDSLAEWHDTSSDTGVSHGAESNKDHEIAAATPAQDSRDVFRQGIEWLLGTQRMATGIVTDTPAGGWAASPTAGAELNTIATAEAVWLLAQGFGPVGASLDERIERAAGWGVGWLLEMQNDDGGWGTYSRNDDAQAGAASCVDATAASVRAIAAWHRYWKIESPRYTRAALHDVIGRLPAAIERAIEFLESVQRDDGSFIPLWFGNQHQANDENPVLGTCQVLEAVGELNGLDSNTAQRAAGWLLASQHASGGWGPPRAPVDYSENDSRRSWRDNEALDQFCSVEETAAAVMALLPLAARTPAFERAVSRGSAWLANAIEQDRHRRPAIIGFYFPQIWYYDRLYPLVFAAEALSQAMATLVPPALAVTAIR